MPLDKILSARLDINRGVSIQISPGGSFTVPQDEVLAVTVSARAVADAASGSSNQSSERTVAINGVTVASSEAEGSAVGSKSSQDAENASASATTTFPFETILDSGDTISATNTGVQLGGFEIS
jgi:type IV secretory pathway TrbL component